MEEIKLKKAMIEIAHLKGAAKSKISDKTYEKSRIAAFEEISKKLR